MKLNYLEYSKESCSFSEEKDRAILVSLSVTGYYSLPVRLLSLLAEKDDDVSKQWDVQWAEWNNSDDLEECCNALLAAKPALIAFSVNIWNLLQVQELSSLLKSANPDLRILCGGQEVTHSFVDFLQTTPAWDYIIDGDGEVAFLQFLKNWDTKKGELTEAESVSGLRYRAADGTTRTTRPAESVTDLDHLPSIIRSGMVSAMDRNRLGVMLEGARGCNCRCTFCFEGYCNSKVRFSGVDNLAEDVQCMMDKGARLFHLLDPIVASHNAERTKDIMNIFNTLFQDNRDLHLSVEAYAERMDEENCRMLGQPYVSLDLGLQSLNPDTLKAIQRPFRKDRFLRGLTNLKKTPARTNIYLICGLPFETSTTFIGGMNEVLRLNADQVFLNELVILNGTELRQQIADNDWGYEYNPKPPYDMTANRWIPARALAAIYAMSKAVADWYNNAKVPSMFHQPAEKEVCLDSREALQILFESGKLYWHNTATGNTEALTNASNAPVQGSKVVLQLQEADSKALKIAINRLQFWGCARVTVQLPQRSLNETIAGAGLRIIRMEVENPETLTDGFIAYARSSARALGMHSFCVELLWPEDQPLPTDPDFYAQLSRAPFATVSILLSGHSVPGNDMDAFLASLDAAHAAKVWIRMPSGAPWRKRAIEYIWPDESNEILRELEALDTIFDPLPDRIPFNTSELENA